MNDARGQARLASLLQTWREDDQVQAERCGGIFRTVESGKEEIEMALDDRDREMMAVSVPTVDYFEMREDLDRLEDAVIRLEKVVEALNPSP